MSILTPKRLLAAMALALPFAQAAAEDSGFSTSSKVVMPPSSQALPTPPPGIAHRAATPTSPSKPDNVNASAPSVGAKKPVGRLKNEEGENGGGPDKGTVHPAVITKKKPVSLLDKPLPGKYGRIVDGGLPGLGVPPGKPKAIKPLVISIVNGVTEMITISKRMPNRIATPYKDPKVIDASGAEIQTIGSDVFILPTDSKPFGVYITGGQEEGMPVASLTLIPQDLPSQNILLQIDRRVPVISGASNNRRGEVPEEYTRSLVFMLRKAMMGRMPDGFVLANINVGTVQIGPLSGIPEKRWSSSKLDIYRYKLENTGDETVEITEQSFYESGVKAVSFYPSKTIIGPGESIYVFIVSGNTASSVFQKMDMTTQVIGN